MAAAHVDASAKSISNPAAMPPLACPFCRVRLESAERGWACSEHGSFPDRAGIASLCIDRAERTAFDAHWESALDARAESKVAVAHRFLASGPPLDLPAAILDVGCGDGVHLPVLRQLYPSAAISGVEISVEALRSAMQGTDGWRPVHADASALPFGDEGYDLTISYGVLAYLNDPWRGLSEMTRVTKRGGFIGVWFAPQRGDFLEKAFFAVRAITGRLPRMLQRRAADLIVPFLGLLPTTSGLSLRTGSWRECREVVLVNIAPTRLTFPTEAELLRKFAELDCEIVAIDQRAPLTVWARRR